MSHYTMLDWKKIEKNNNNNKIKKKEGKPA